VQRALRQFPVNGGEAGHAVNHGRSKNCITLSKDCKMNRRLA
jgi:hypothetical protein